MKTYCHHIKLDIKLQVERIGVFEQHRSVVCNRQYRIVASAVCVDAVIVHKPQIIALAKIIAEAQIKDNRIGRAVENKKMSVQFTTQNRLKHHCCSVGCTQ